MRRLKLFLACVVLALAARGGAAAADSFDGKIRDETITTSKGHRLAASVYSPLAVGPAGLRAVVLCHGISAARGHVDSLARELARRGFLAVTFDFGGHGDSEEHGQEDELLREDVRAAIALAQRSGARGPVAVVGHSMGALVAAQVGVEDSIVRCVVTLGQEPAPTEWKPRWLLACAGAMDAFHSYGAMTKAAGVDAFETKWDREKTHTVRRLVISGSCEHAGEVWDATLLGETVAFVDAALTENGAPPGEAATVVRPALAASCRFVANVATAAALAIVGLALGGALGVSSSPPGVRPSPRELALRRIAAVPVLLLALVPFFLARAGLVSVELARSLLPALLVGAMISGTLLGRQPRWRVALAVLLGWIAGTAIDAAPAWAKHPELARALPLYVWQGVAFRVEFTLESLAAKLVEAPLASAPHGTALLYALVAAELAWPGSALALVAWFAVRLFRAVGGKMPEAPPEEREGDTSEDAQVARAIDRGAPTDAAGGHSRKKLGAVLLVLVAIAVAMFTKRAKEGLLSEEGALSSILVVGLRLLVPPVVALTGAAWLFRVVDVVRGKKPGKAAAS